jgi:hypothetical protein
LDELPLQVPLVTRDDVNEPFATVVYLRRETQRVLPAFGTTSQPT